MTPPTANPIADRRINDVLDRLHARAGRELPGLVANFALGVVKDLVDAKRADDSDEKYVRDKLIPIDRGQGWLIYMLCRSLQGTLAGRFNVRDGSSSLECGASAAIFKTFFDRLAWNSNA